MLVKLVFDVEDVEASCAKARAEGLEFGTVQRGEGDVFANAKDPSKTRSGFRAGRLPAGENVWAGPVRGVDFRRPAP